jgi:hypothetical protein
MKVNHRWRRDAEWPTVLAVEQHRGNSSDGKWYDGGEWDRGRHGVPSVDARSYDEPSAYGTDTAGYSGNQRVDDYESLYAEPAGGAPGAVGPRSGEPLPPGPGDDVPLRSLEALDVGARQGSSTGAPPDEQPYPDSSYSGSDYRGSDYSGSDYSGSDYATAYPPPPSSFFGGSASTDYANPYASEAAAAAQEAIGEATPPVSTRSPASTGRSRSPSRFTGFQSSRSAIALGVAVIVVLLEVVPVRLVLSSVLADPVHTPGTVAGIFLMAGLPTLAYGMVTLSGDSPSAGWTSWTRLPLICVPLGVVLLICAALAAA